MRTRIAALSPKDAVAVPSLAATAACLATWAGGLLFGGDGVTGLRFRRARGCLPRTRDRLGRHDSFGFDQGLCSVPSCPVNVPKVSRGCRTAVLDAPCCPSTGGTSVSIRPRRLKCGNVTNPCLPVHHPGRLQNALPFRKRHLDVDSRKLRLPRPCRIPAGCLVSQSVEVPSDDATIQRHLSPLIVLLAPRQHQNRMFSRLAAAALHADLASRHYRMSAAPGGAPDVVTGRMPHGFATGTPPPSPDARAPVSLVRPATPQRRSLRSPTRARSVPN